MNGFLWNFWRVGRGQRSNWLDSCGNQNRYPVPEFLNPDHNPGSGFWKDSLLTYDDSYRQTRMKHDMTSVCFLVDNMLLLLFVERLLSCKLRQKRMCWNTWILSHCMQWFLSFSTMALCWSLFLMDVLKSTFTNTRCCITQLYVHYGIYIACYAKPCIGYDRVVRQSVTPSICPSHAGTELKQHKLR